MLENKNEILFTNCDFDIDEDSGSSINIDRIYKVSKVKINVVDCSFKGKMSSETHYIDVKVPSDYLNNLMIKSCKFEDVSKKAVNTVVEDRNIIPENNLKLALICVSLFTVVAIVAIMNKIRSRFIVNDIDNDQIEIGIDN